MLYVIICSFIFYSGFILGDIVLDSSFQRLAVKFRKSFQLFIEMRKRNDSVMSSSIVDKVKQFVAYTQ